MCLYHFPRRGDGYDLWVLFPPIVALVTHLHARSVRVYACERRVCLFKQDICPEEGGQAGRLHCGLAVWQGWDSFNYSFSRNYAFDRWKRQSQRVFVMFFFHHRLLVSGKCSCAKDGLCVIGCWRIFLLEQFFVPYACVHIKILKGCYDFRPAFDI